MNPETTKKTARTNEYADYLGENLIFLISQPRSGSTLLQRLLAGHSDIQTSAETWLMLHPVYGLRRHGIQTEYRADWAATGVEEFLEHYADGRETYVAGLRSFAQTIYGRILAPNGEKYFLDKTPRYTMIVPELVELFPKAKYVFLIRNPLAVLSSELNTYIRDKYWKLADYNPDLVDAPDRLVEGTKICADQAITIHYEALVADPDKSIREICEHLCIDFQSDMLEYGNRPAPIGSMNDPSGIHQHSRPTVDSLDKWRQLGQNSQRRHFALSYLNQLGPKTLAALGYDPTALAAAIHNTKINQKVRPIYPWKLAMTQKQEHGFRDQLFSRYCHTAQHHGRLRGLLAAVELIANKFFGQIRRLLRGSANPREADHP